MPRGDGTGPSGMGPMTGRGMGYCAGFDVPGFVNSGPVGYGRGRGFAGRGLGRGYGRGLGMGRGFGWRSAGYGVPPYYGGAYNWDYQPYTKDEEMTSLRNQADYLKEHLEAIEKRIEEIDNTENE